MESATGTASRSQYGLACPPEYLSLVISFALSILAIGLVAGLFIGSVGIGGVIIAPTLILLFGVPTTSALAATMFAFVFSGLIGAGTYSAKQSLNWNSATWLWIGAAPAALVAGLITHRIAAPLIETAIALLALFAGIYSFRPPRDVETKPATGTTPRGTLISSGLISGSLSTLTGTSGPLVLIPVLLGLDIPIIAALGLAQAIQLPIALMGTAGHWLAGTAEPILGVTLGIGLGIGTWGGAHIAHRLSQRSLHLAVSTLLVAVGLAMLIHLVLRTATESSL